MGEDMPGKLILLDEVSQLGSLVEIIKDISGLHEIHSSEWLRLNPNIINLKTKLIRDICTYNREDESELISFDSEFIKHLNRYCADLNEVMFSPYYDFLEWNIDHSSRIKNPESRLAKMIYYSTDKSEVGKVSINKCLNDLFGFRVLMDDFNHNDTYYGLIKENIADTNCRIHNSCKNEYNATHIYFTNGNNKCFPWELQIWNKKDAEKNFHSHFLHKQGYTKWAKNLKKNNYYREDD